MEGSEDSSGRSTKKAVSHTVKAGLKFSVGKIHRDLNKGRHAKRIEYSAAVYTAAVLQYIAAEVLELAGNATRDRNNSHIDSRQIQRVLRNDDELAKLVATVSREEEVENMITKFSRFELDGNDELAKLVAKVRREEDPSCSVEVDNIVTKFRRFELDGNDGVSASSGRMDLVADSQSHLAALRQDRCSIKLRK